MKTLDEKKLAAEAWFLELRDSICKSFQALEEKYAGKTLGEGARFKRKNWQRQDHSSERAGGGGEMSVMYGRVFESVGVNISTVHGQFPENFRSEMQGSGDNGDFWASGISVIAHMMNPFVPAIHMNTRFICTEKSWFGGGIDLTPLYPTAHITDKFHDALKSCCFGYDETAYEKYKAECDRYFYLPHRKEPRGVGGIFFDGLETIDWEKDFSFVQSVGRTFETVYSEIIQETARTPYVEMDRENLMIKRGRYVEFNLLYDRGTRFGLMTNGNIEAILVSMPPSAKWHPDKWTPI